MTLRITDPKGMVGDPTRRSLPRLEREAEDLLGLARRVRTRLRRILQHAEEREARNPEVTPWTPDEDWTESARWCTQTVLGLLREQRERAKVLAKLKGGEPMTDAEAELELQEVIREELSRMTPEQVRSLLAKDATPPEPDDAI